MPSTPPPSGDYLADVNLWLATVLEAHPSHLRAADWWRDEIVPQGRRVCFCRLTQLGLLCLLTNQTVMGPLRRTPEQAWGEYDQLLAQEPVLYVHEPQGIDPLLRAESSGRDASSSVWTDAYLAAFAQAADLGLATFDRGFRHFPNVKLTLL